MEQKHRPRRYASFLHKGNHAIKQAMQDAVSAQRKEESADGQRSQELHRRLAPAQDGSQQRQRETGYAKKAPRFAVETRNQNAKQLDGMQAELTVNVIRNDVLPADRLRQIHPTQCQAAVFL